MLTDVRLRACVPLASRFADRLADERLSSVLVKDTRPTRSCSHKSLSLSLSFVAFARILFESCRFWVWVEWKPLRSLNLSCALSTWTLSLSLPRNNKIVLSPKPDELFYPTLILKLILGWVLTNSFTRNAWKWCFFSTLNKLIINCIY